MKKLLSIALVLLMVGSIIAGCSTQNNLSDAVESAVSEQAAAVEYVPGTRTSTGYVNEELGLKYTLSNNLVMATDDEINNMMQIGADIMYEDSKTGEQMIDYAKVSTIYEMMAVSVLDNTSINIVSEKLFFASLTEDHYIEALKNQLSQTNTDAEYKEVTTEEIAGIPFTRLDYTLTVNGMEIQQTMLLKKVKNRMVLCTLTYFTQEQFDALLSGFSALD